MKSSCQSESNSTGEIVETTEHRLVPPHDKEKKHNTSSARSSSSKESSWAGCVWAHVRGYLNPPPSEDRLALVGAGSGGGGVTMTSAREAGQRRKAVARGLTMALHMCSPLIPQLLSSSPRNRRKCILLSRPFFFYFPLMDRQWPRRGGGWRKEGNVRIFFSPCFDINLK